METQDFVHPLVHQFVFVTGLHRSGTSPLYRCLRGHPQISGFHDTGVPEDEGQHLQTVLPRGGSYGGPGRFARHPEAHMTEAHPLATPETTEALFAQWSPYWDLAKPYLLEKTPITLTRTRLFQALFPSAYFVVLIRHPAAIALATYNALASSGSVPDLTVADLVEHWVIAYETFLEDAPHLRQKMVVRYEDFAENPQNVLDALSAFLGIPRHLCSEKIDTHVNARYRQQWWAMSRDPQHQADIQRAGQFEERTRGFGYSLQDWAEAEPPIAATFPPVLETDRLMLRGFTFADLDGLAALFADAETMRFLGGARRREQVWGEIAQYLGEYKRAGVSFWAVIEKAEGRLIGRCGLQQEEVEGRPETELGYVIARPSWGQGFGTEAARAVTEYVFANTQRERLISIIDPLNSASMRVAEKNGMHHETNAPMDERLHCIYAVNKPAPPK